MKTITTILLLVSTICYSQKNWELIENKEETVMFERMPTDTTDVKILLKDKLVEAKRISKVIRRLSKDYYGEIFCKTIGYLVDGNLLPSDEISYEMKIQPVIETGWHIQDGTITLENLHSNTPNIYLNENN